MENSTVTRWLRYYFHPDLSYPLAIIEGPGKQFIYKIQDSDRQSEAFTSMAEVLVDLEALGLDTGLLSFLKEWEILWDPTVSGELQ